MITEPIEFEKAENRVGRFAVSLVLLDGHWPDLMPLMREVVVVQADYLHDEALINYVAYSPAFDVVPEGEKAPEYQITSHRQGNRTWVTFEKVSKDDACVEASALPTGVYTLRKKFDGEDSFDMCRGAGFPRDGEEMCHSMALADCVEFFASRNKAAALDLTK